MRSCPTHCAPGCGAGCGPRLGRLPLPSKEAKHTHHHHEAAESSHLLRRTRGLRNKVGAYNTRTVWCATLGAVSPNEPQESEQTWRRKDAELAYKHGVRDATVEARFRNKTQTRLRLVSSTTHHVSQCMRPHACCFPQHFVAWQQITAIKKIEKHMFAEFQKKMQLMALMKPKPSKYNSQAVFNAWRLFVALAHAQKLQWKLAATKEYVDCQRQQGV